MGRWNVKTGGLLSKVGYWNKCGGRVNMNGGNEIVYETGLETLQIIKNPESALVTVGIGENQWLVC